MTTHMNENARVTHIFLCLALIASNLVLPNRVYAAPVIPPVWDIQADDFEGGVLDLLELSSPLSPALVHGGGINGSTGLSVPISAG